MGGVLLSAPLRLWLWLQAKLVPLIWITVPVVAVFAVVLRFRSSAVASDADIVSNSVNVLVILYAAIAGSGVVSGDMGDGPGQLWLQRPVHPVAFYLRRQAEAGCLALLLCILAVLLAGFGSAWLGLRLDPDPVLSLHAYVIRCAMIVGLCFGVSSWINRGNTVVVLAIFAASVVIDSELSLMDGWVATAARAVVLPNEAGRALSRALAGSGESIWIEGARVAGFLLAWLTIGCIGIWRATARRGLTLAN